MSTVLLKLLRLLAFVGTIGIVNAQFRIDDYYNLPQFGTDSDYNLLPSGRTENPLQHTHVEGYHRYQHATFSHVQCEDIKIIDINNQPVTICTDRCNQMADCTVVSVGLVDYKKSKCYLQSCPMNKVPEPVITTDTQDWVSYAKRQPNGPPTKYHDNLKIDCIYKAENELMLWEDLKNLAARLHHEAEIIYTHPEWLEATQGMGCDELDPHHKAIQTLDEVHDYTQIKVLREASEAAFHDLVLVVAHFNIIISAQDGIHKCWEDTLDTAFYELKTRGIPNICSLSNIINADAEAVLDKVISLESQAKKFDCFRIRAVVCGLLDHMQKLAAGLLSFVVPR